MAADPASVDAVPRLLLRVPEAAQAIGVAGRTFMRLASAGRIGPQAIKVGGTTLFNRAELEVWAASAVDGVLPTRAEWTARRRDALARGKSQEQ